MDSAFQLRVLRALYEGARMAESTERLKLFLILRDVGDDLARLYIYTDSRPGRFGIAYANLAHNYGNALMRAMGSVWRMDTGNWRRSEGYPDYTPAECQTELQDADGVLVANFESILTLLEEATVYTSPGEPHSGQVNDEAFEQAVRDAGLG